MDLEEFGSLECETALEQEQGDIRILMAFTHDVGRIFNWLMASLDQFEERKIFPSAFCRTYPAAYEAIIPVSLNIIQRDLEQAMMNKRLLNRLEENGLLSINTYAGGSEAQLAMKISVFASAWQKFKDYIRRLLADEIRDLKTYLAPDDLWDIIKSILNSLLSALGMGEAIKEMVDMIKFRPDFNPQDHIA